MDAICEMDDQFRIQRANSSAASLFRFYSGGTVESQIDVIAHADERSEAGYCTRVGFAEPAISRGCPVDSMPVRSDASPFAAEAVFPVLISRNAAAIASFCAMCRTSLQRNRLRELGTKTDISAQ